ncbi:hypothetical protein E2C01_059105 [Portunus trituberculatus]|uniref:Uncharacterized protein n=1 Tax=Portunus trituberculatus TaxID=210409 RepID=A0A5B7H1M7_PORTR|nr:hypothetical protein [Portunus trituberculatus]
MSREQRSASQTTPDGAQMPAGLRKASGDDTILTQLEDKEYNEGKNFAEGITDTPQDTGAGQLPRGPAFQGYLGASGSRSAAHSQGSPKQSHSGLSSSSSSRPLRSPLPAGQLQAGVALTSSGLTLIMTKSLHHHRHDRRCLPPLHHDLH